MLIDHCQTMTDSSDLEVLKSDSQMRLIDVLPSMPKSLRCRNRALYIFTMFRHSSTWLDISCKQPFGAI